LSLFGGSRRWICFILSCCSLTLTTVDFFRFVEFLQQCCKILNGSKFFKAKELLLLDLLIGEVILGHCCLQKVESVEKINLRAVIVKAKLKMLFQAAFQIVQIIYL